MSPSLYHASKSIPCVQVYTITLSLYLESFFIPYLQVQVQVDTINLSLYHTIRFRIKSNFTMKEIQFHIRTNSISHLKQFNFTMEQIQFPIGTNPISNCNQSSFTMEQIKFHIFIMCWGMVLSWQRFGARWTELWVNMIYVYRASPLVV